MGAKLGTELGTELACREAACGGSLKGAAQRMVGGQRSRLVKIAVERILKFLTTGLKRFVDELFKILFYDLTRRVRLCVRLLDALHCSLASGGGLRQARNDKADKPPEGKPCD